MLPVTGAPVHAALLAHVRALFQECRASLVAAGVPIDSFQDFGAEIDGLPGKYAAEKHGALVLAVDPAAALGFVKAAAPVRGAAASASASSAAAPAPDLPAGTVYGCIALRDLGDGVAEVKRLFVTPAGRGRGVGRALSQYIIDVAKRLPVSPADGTPYYTRRIVLDTLVRLPGAIPLYTSLGFSPCAAYCVNPMPDVVYMEMPL